MFRRAAFLVVLTTLPVAVRAQSADPAVLVAFAGEWRNASDTNAIVEARVYQQNGRWLLQLLGACQPAACVWDPLPLTAAGPQTVAPRATATFSQSNMRRQITLRLGEDSLVVTVASHQLAVPARGIGERRYTSTDELTFLKAKTEPLPPLRRRPRQTLDQCLSSNSRKRTLVSSPWGSARSRSQRP
jgi:hypothetical protein